jgi:hypothetical protein
MNEQTDLPGCRIPTSHHPRPLPHRHDLHHAGELRFCLWRGGDDGRAARGVAVNAITTRSRSRAKLFRAFGPTRQVEGRTTRGKAADNTT